MNSTPTNLYKTAKIISVIGSPFVLFPFTVFTVAFYDAPPEWALTVGLITVLAIVVPLLFVIRRKVVAGKWSDHDVSDSTERRNFYAITITIVGVCSLLFWLLNFPRSIVIGIIVSLGLLLAAALINWWSKISLHLMFVMYCAVSLITLNYWIALTLIFFAVLVGWSRVFLGRHSLGQVLTGAALGTLGGLFLIKVISVL